MLAMCLEGGGARGAYQAGVLTVLLENGYKFHAVAGTSIGALNGVMLAQGEYEKSLEMWQNLEFSKLFDFNSQYAIKVAKGEFNPAVIKSLFKAIKIAVANKGLDTSRVKDIINGFIDEDKLRSSGIEFGLMTVSFNEIKPYPLFLDDIPQGLVGEYVMASANFPGFEKMQIGDKVFLDGGAYDNLPLNMLYDRGYKDIIAIETGSKMPKKALRKDCDAQVRFITPSAKPGRMLEFNNGSILRSIEIGKYDALRVVYGYVGEMYFLDLTDESSFGYGLLDLSDFSYASIARLYGYKEKTIDKERAIAHIISEINKIYKKKYTSLDSSLLHIMERAALQANVERLAIYKFSEFLDMICNNSLNIGEKSVDLISIGLIFYEIKVAKYEKNIKKQWSNQRN